MKIYIVIISDRHSDTEVRPFYNPNEAVTAARDLAKSYCRYKEDYEEEQLGRDIGWLFYATYSCEGDHVHVVTAEMQDDK